MKETIRPHYEQLQAILGQTPKPNGFESVSRNVDSIKFFDNVRDDIQKITNENLSRYVVAVRNHEFNILLFRQKINALIMYLHGKYFPDEKEPFSGSPQIVMNQKQEQKQSASPKINITIRIVISIVVIFIVGIAIIKIFF